jgi:hypothetical protein
MVMATLLKNRSRSVGLARSARLGLLARLVPGSAHLALGETGRAVLRAALLASGLFGIVFAWCFDPSRGWTTPGLVLAEETVQPIFFPLPAAAWQGWAFWPVVTGLVLVILAYATALLDATQLRRRIPEHFLLAAGERAPNAARRAT